MNKPKNLFLIGPMGAGKSTIGRNLARAFKLDFYDSDKEIEARCGANIPWIFDLEGEAGFRKREEMAIEHLTAMDGIVLATGGGAVLSVKNRMALAKHGIVIYLKVSLEQQYTRLARDRNRPLLQTANLDEVLENLRKQREPLYEELADYSFTTDGKNVLTVTDEIIQKIKELKYFG